MDESHSHGQCRKDWMSRLPNPLQKLPLNKLAIPGMFTLVPFYPFMFENAFLEAILNIDIPFKEY